LTCHGDRAWSWYQAAQGADPAGPLAGVRYDGLMSKADGKGLWWEGLDPQDLYAQYHPVGSYAWTQSPGGRGGAAALAATVPLAKNFSEKFFNRTIDLINKYQPDQLYFDDTILPIYPSTDIGLRIAAYLYNTNLARKGKLEAVLTTKGLTGENADKRKALVLDIERGVSSEADPLPWQTDTCIGEWHYRRSIFDQHRYKTVGQVVQMLVDIVSKNGCLQLNVPLPGNGLPDADELKFIEGLTVWMDMNSEGIYATRPWKTYGEGPSVAAPAARGQFGGARDVRPYTAEDFRYVQKGDTLFAFAMGWPEDGKLKLTALAEGSPHAPGAIERVELLGMKEALKFTRDHTGLVVVLPEKKIGDHAHGVRINGRGLTARA
jgi:alpha-L-fucosidase